MLDINRQQERLVEDKNRLESELSTLGIQDKNNPADWTAVPDNVGEETDFNSAADTVEDWDERVAILAALETDLNNVNRALKKITAGTYGICEVSGEMIEEERLEANPAARTCLLHLDDEYTLPL